MSFLGKIFGGGNGGKKSAPTPQEAIQKLRDTESMLVKKQDFLEKKIDDEITSAKKHGTKNKRLALQALKRKKQYENQLKQIDNTLTTIEFQRQALENAATNAHVLSTLSDAANAMKAEHKNMDVDKVHSLMDDIAEQQDVAREISEAISVPTGFMQDIDEDELLSELEALEQEELDKQLLDVGPSPADKLPNVPQEKVAAKSHAATKKKEQEDKDMAELEAWASSAWLVL